MTDEQIRDMSAIRWRILLMVEAGRIAAENRDRESTERSDPMLETEVANMNNPMVNSNELSTTIPLGSTNICLGFGPMNIEEPDLVKEDIGLKEPIIVRD